MCQYFSLHLCISPTIELDVSEWLTVTNQNKITISYDDIKTVAFANQFHFDRSVCVQLISPVFQIRAIVGVELLADKNVSVRVGYHHRRVVVICESYSKPNRHPNAILEILHITRDFVAIFV